MPFELFSVPSAFQKAMDTVLAELPGVTVYMDDIVVHGPSIAVHRRRLAAVLDSFSRYGFTLNVRKCQFEADSVEFFGHRVSAAGLVPLQTNTSTVLNLPAPTSAKEVSSFLDMTNFYARFLPNYSTVSAPLRRLLKKGEPWVWSEREATAFQSLKRMITAAPVLAHFEIAADTWVTCDASATAVGAVLSQATPFWQAPRCVCFAPVE
eukprot:m.286810 g.286810  ORF g.286810 m.286810 type:complete len:208 (+) comp40699_c0_seq27:695-1318(+)